MASPVAWNAFFQGSSPSERHSPRQTMAIRIVFVKRMQRAAGPCCTHFRPTVAFVFPVIELIEIGRSDGGETYFWLETRWPPAETMASMAGSTPNSGGWSGNSVWTRRVRARLTRLLIVPTAQLHTLAASS